MNLDDFVKLWNHDIPFEQKTRLYYEKVPHIIDDKGGYRPINCEYRKATLRYFKNDGQLEIFDDYTIDTNKIIERKDNIRPPTPRKLNEYLNIKVSKNGNSYNRSLARAMLSTFLGPPPTLEYTIDHIESDQKLDDNLDNLRWLHKSGQSKNQKKQEKYKTARLIVNDGKEFTAKEWIDLYKKTDGTKYHEHTFREWARTKENGFSYKTYDDLDDEEWKIYGEPDKNHVEVSNMNRVKDVMFSASGREEHVLSVDQLSLLVGYPTKIINGERYYLHVLVFQLWYPKEWSNKLSNEIVLHKHDDRLDCRPENLRLGTPSDNGKDAHDNGKHDGTKTARKSCVSYINGVKEKEHISLLEAERFLKDRGYSKASYIAISNVLSGKRKTAYDRVWKLD
ncbi:hypothetical protein AR158_C540L [Paramecium bursaria Chlorella virus AR158]|uniref:hypothetical protein n=1 Tax=Paramecium bursaria Chlorella virus AR158 TaxID=380598 RepID=UPI00015AA759|nr:hypothetical protein AR158_C540L [Paramecium bursaria Chlorella virus AR158]ABU44085.1 hypothetical protein AR158_C540L [Paramecium bursaria Chlorella virus AR158]AGE54312.1 hypothetical protein PBCVIL52s1_629L [Paramecium bursaria Chlorella virus IL-5-2s1]